MLADGVAAALAAGDACAAKAEADRLGTATVAAINAGRVPPPFQEPLLAEAQELAARIECAPPPPPAATDEDDDDGDRARKGKGKGKGKDKDRDGGKGRRGRGEEDD